MSLLSVSLFRAVYRPILNFLISAYFLFFFPVQSAGLRDVVEAMSAAGTLVHSLTPLSFEELEEVRTVGLGLRCNFVEG